MANALLDYGQMANALLHNVSMNQPKKGISPLNTLEGGGVAPYQGGRTIRAYHGTKGEWSSFDPKKSTREAYGSGMHVASDPKLANMFAGQFREGGSVMPVTVNLRKTASQDTYKKFAERFGYDPKQTTRALKKAGYDSVEYNHGQFYWNQGGKLVQSAPGQDKAFSVLRPGRVKSSITGETLFGLDAGLSLSDILSGAIDRQEPEPPR